MEFKSLLDELRSGSLSSRDPGTLAAELAAALDSQDEEIAERAALAAYYASILPEPVVVPGFDALLLEPARESRERLRGRLWWIQLSQTANKSSDDPSPVAKLAEAILVQERGPYARHRVFVFLKSWPLRSAIFPFLGSRPISSIEIPDDGRAVDLLKEEARIAAGQAVSKGYSVARSAERAVASWATGELGIDDASAAVRVAEPLLGEFPWGGLNLAALAAAALDDTAVRPKLRGAVQLYGAWLWSRFDESQSTDKESQQGTEPRTCQLPSSWKAVLQGLAAYRKDDPWCNAALLKLEAMLATSPMLAAGPSSATSNTEPPQAFRNSVELRLALAHALASPAPKTYSGPACEQSATEVLKPTLARLALKGGPAISSEEAEALAMALRSSSPYRVEAASTVLRAYTKVGVDIRSALPAMVAALLAAPADSGGLSAGTDFGPGDLTQKSGCDAPKAFDDADHPPDETEKGFMNLDNLTMLLAMCMPASSAHRLAKGLEAALGSGTLSPTDQKLVTDTLHTAAKAGNVVAKDWLKGHA